MGRSCRCVGRFTRGSTYQQAIKAADAGPRSVEVKAILKHDFSFMVFQVPFRRVHLTDGTYFDKYDTTGPQVAESQSLSEPSIV